MQKTDTREVTECRGYSLFLDVEDEELRAKNRAVVLRNMLTSRPWNGKQLPSATASEVVRYFAKVPKEDRSVLFPVFRKLLEDEGLAGVWR